MRKDVAQKRMKHRETAKADSVKTKRSVSKDKAQKVKSKNESQKIPETAKADDVKRKNNVKKDDALKSWKKK